MIHSNFQKRAVSVIFLMNNFNALSTKNLIPFSFIVLRWWQKSLRQTKVLKRFKLNRHHHFVHYWVSDSASGMSSLLLLGLRYLKNLLITGCKKNKTKKNN